jgi:arylsulfatase
MIAPQKYKQRFLDLGYDQNTAGRYGMIENIDDNFALLMNKLDEWDAWDNTLVIFMTDNGQAGRRATLDGRPTRLHTAGFKTGKGSQYEGGTHVPAFWSWKSVLGRGVDVPALTAHIDLFKTFCELCGAQIPSGIQQLDGRSLLPLLENPRADWSDRTLFVHRGRWEKGADPNESKFVACAVRTQRWRFVNNKQLYDISADPYESQDVAADHPGVVSQLRRAYDSWWAETVPFMVNEDAPYAPRQPQAVRYEKQLKERGIPKWIAPQI